MPQNPALQNYLQKLNVPDDVKADAWDAFTQAKDQNDFYGRFKSLNLPDNAKADLWDMRFNGTRVSPTGSLADVSPVAPKKFSIFDGIPDIGKALHMPKPPVDMNPVSVLTGVPMRGTKYEAVASEQTPQGHAQAVAQREKEMPVVSAAGKAFVGGLDLLPEHDIPVIGGTVGRPGDTSQLLTRFATGETREDLQDFIKHPENYDVQAGLGPVNKLMGSKHAQTEDALAVAGMLGGGEANVPDTVSSMFLSPGGLAFVGVGATEAALGQRYLRTSAELEKTLSVINQGGKAAEGATADLAAVRAEAESAEKALRLFQTAHKGTSAAFLGQGLNEGVAGVEAFEKSKTPYEKSLAASRIAQGASMALMSGPHAIGAADVPIPSHDKHSETDVANVPPLAPVQREAPIQQPVYEFPKPQAVDTNPTMPEAKAPVTTVIPTTAAEIPSEAPRGEWRTVQGKSGPREIRPVLNQEGSTLGFEVKDGEFVPASHPVFPKIQSRYDEATFNANGLGEPHPKTTYQGSDIAEIINPPATEVKQAAASNTEAPISPEKPVTKMVETGGEFIDKLASVYQRSGLSQGKAREVAIASAGIIARRARALGEEPLTHLNKLIADIRFGEGDYEAFAQQRDMGKEVNQLSPEQLNSPEIKARLGNTIIRDEDGLPKPLFHWTKALYRYFKGDISEMGIHLGTAEQADFRGSGNSGTSQQYGGRTIPMYVRLENPLRMIDRGGWNFDEVAERLAGIDREFAENPEHGAYPKDPKIFTEDEIAPIRLYRQKIEQATNEASSTWNELHNVDYSGQAEKYARGTTYYRVDPDTGKMESYRVFNPEFAASGILGAPPMPPKGQHWWDSAAESNKPFHLWNEIGLTPDEARWKYDRKLKLKADYDAADVKRKQLEAEGIRRVQDLIRSKGYDGIVSLNRYELNSAAKVEGARAKAVYDARRGRVSDEDFKRIAGNLAQDSYLIFSHDQTINALSGLDKFERQQKYELSENEMKELAPVLFQADSNGKRILGTTSFLEDGRAIIWLHRNADASTFTHEMLHVWRRNLPVEEQEAINQAYHVQGNQWSRDDEERFARDGEAFLTKKIKTGDERTDRLFRTFRTWLEKIYHGIQGSPLSREMSTEVTDFYRKFFGFNASDVIHVTDTKVAEPSNMPTPVTKENTNETVNPKMETEPGPIRSAAQVAAEYGKVIGELKRVRTRLKRADDAKRSGKKQYALDDDVYEAGKLTEQKLEEQRLEVFREWVAQVPEEKAGRILESIENRIRKSVGTGMQLNRLLQSAETNQLIRKALRMHSSAEGLDQDTSLAISKLLGGEEVGPFLSKGPDGQRQRLFRMLGYAERKDASGSTLMVPRILRFMPKGELGEEMARENELARAYLREQIANTTDPGQRTKLENLLYVDHDISNKAGEVVYKRGSERTNIILAKAQIKEQIRSAADSRYGVETSVEHPDLSISNLRQILGRELHDKMGRPSKETRDWLKNLRETDPEAYRVEKARLTKEFVQRELDRTREEVRRHQRDLAAFKEARNAPKGATTRVEEEIISRIPTQNPEAIAVDPNPVKTEALSDTATPKQVFWSNLENFARKLTRGEQINPDTVTMLKLRGVIKQDSKSTASYIKDVRDFIRRDQTVEKAKTTVSAQLDALQKAEYVYRKSSKTGEIMKLKVVGPSDSGKGVKIERNGKHYDLKRTDVFLTEDAARGKAKPVVEAPKSTILSDTAKEGQPVPMDAQELIDRNRDLMPDNYTYGKSTSTEPIVVNQYGAVVDGHNRLNSAVRQGKEVSVVVRKGPEMDVGAPVEMPTGKKGRIMKILDGKTKVRGEDGKVYQFPVDKLKLNKPQPSAPKPVTQKPVETTVAEPPVPEDGFIPSAEDTAFANSIGNEGLDALIAKSEAEKRDAAMNWLSKKADELRDNVITAKDKKLLLRRLNLPPDAQIGKIRQTISILKAQTADGQAEPVTKPSTGFSADEQTVWDSITRIGKEIVAKNADFRDAFSILKQEASKQTGDRLAQMKLLERATKVFYTGEVKGDPFKMKNALDSLRVAQDLHQLEERPETVRSYPKKDYTPEAERLIAKEYLKTRLKEWKGYDDMEIIEHADDVHNPEVDRMLEALNDPNYTKLVAKHRGRVTQNTDVVEALAFGLTQGDITKGVLREMLGNVKYDRETLLHGLNSYLKTWDKRSIGDTLNFVDSIERGDLSGLSESDAQLAGLLRKALDERRDKIHNLGKGYLEHFYENYFPHMWKKPGKFTEFYNLFASKHPLAPKSFLKQRTLPLYADGIQAGLEPVTYNPVRMAILKMYEMDRFVAAHDAIDSLKEYGTIKYYKYGQKAPEGWVKLKDDPLLEPKIFDKAEGALKQYGNYYAPAEAARVLENLVSRGLAGKYRIYDDVRTFGNFLNQVQLSLSAFHLMFTSIDAATSQMALSVYQAAHGGKALVRGDLGNASREFVKAMRSVAEVPVAPVSNLLRGHKFIAAYTDPKKYLEIQPLVEMIKKGGGSPFQDPIYRTYGTQMFRNAVKEFQNSEGLAKLPKAGKIALRSITMGAEAVSWPLMEWIVPRQKMGVFMAMVSDYMERNQRMGISPAEPVLRADVARIWDSVDNRMGQLIYDNMFMNRAVKDLMMLSMRSPGWNIGTFRELGGGLLDAAGKFDEWNDIRKGKFDKAKVDRFEPISRRTAYIPAIFLTVGLIGAIYQKLRTGEAPTEPVDFFHPKTGNLGTDGYPERVNFASYMKDIYAVTENPAQTAIHKLHPIFSVLGSMYSNRDYYGEQVYDPADNKAAKVLKAGKYAISQAVPFSWTNFKKLEESGAGPGQAVGAFFGITPSPKYIGKTEADNLAFEYYKSTLPSGPFTEEHMEHQRQVHKYRSGYISGKITEDQLGQAIDEGKIKPKDMDNIMDRGKTSPLEFHTKAITDPGQAMRVWKLANPEEKSRLYQTMLQKWDLVSPEDPIFAEYEKELSNFSTLKTH